MTVPSVTDTLRGIQFLGDLSDDLIDQLVSHVFPMSQVQGAFECSTSQESAKIILHPWE